jgi:single-strand DNA-binding protein
MMQIAAYGRLGQDPREIATSTGKAMAVASIAVTLPDRQGEEHTQWLGIIAFGKVAETLLRHVKGDMISASGRAQHNAYTTSNGETREQIQIVADTVLSAKTVRPSGGRRKSETTGNGAHRPADDGAPFDDAIPF